MNEFSTTEDAQYMRGISSVQEHQDFGKAGNYSKLLLKGSLLLQINRLKVISVLFQILKSIN